MAIGVAINFYGYEPHLWTSSTKHRLNGNSSAWKATLSHPSSAFAHATVPLLRREQRNWPLVLPVGRGRFLIANFSFAAKDHPSMATKAVYLTEYSSLLI